MQYPLSLLSGPINTSTDSPYTFRYQFAGTSQPLDPEMASHTGWTALTASEKSAVRAAMDHIESFLNIRFTEITGSSDPDLTIGKVDLPGPTAGLGGYAYSAWSDGTLLDYDGSVVYDNTLDLSSDQNSLILHELGHALALKHPFESITEGGITNGSLPTAFDNLKYTLMSYTANPDTTDEPDFLALFDVFALQNRWGANTSYNTGNNTYTGPRGLGVDVIWDAGGTDTLDGSARTGALRIDLREGEFSRFGSYDDVTIAFGVTIENATGGSAADTLIGNDAANTLSGGAGNDSLTGGAGDDMLQGGAGTDTAIFAVASSAITVTRSGDGFVLASSDGQDTVLETEFFQFTDTTLSRAEIDARAVDGTSGGTAGDDTLSGDATDNELSGEAGNDRLVGYEGNDTLDGGPGADTLNGGDGDDIIIGGPSDDDLRDIIYAGAGHDNIDAGAGNDLVYGQAGNDTIAGGFGVDELQGQEGDDVITGSAYSDLVFGGDGNDFV
ncbi:M10 family metallopeptidase C-terminal domain-containing protein, partial [Ruegeria pomeroyi]|nr:M10 family metallopeptidase C-terminal domain-containing protein [Ruegeria pomeroyi]